MELFAAFYHDPNSDEYTDFIGVFSSEEKARAFINSKKLLYGTCYLVEKVILDTPDITF